MPFEITEVQRALAGMDYPASPQKLAGHAQASGADADLVEALRGLDAERLDGPDDVMRGLKGRLTG